MHELRHSSCTVPWPFLAAQLFVSLVMYTPSNGRYPIVRELLFVPSLHIADDGATCRRGSRHNAFIATQPRDVFFVMIRYGSRLYTRIKPTHFARFLSKGFRPYFYDPDQLKPILGVQKRLPKLTRLNARLTSICRWGCRKDRKRCSVFIRIRTFVWRTFYASEEMVWELYQIFHTKERC